MQINLSNNSGYKWFSNGNIYVKGYIYDSNNRLYADKELIDYFTGEDSFEERLKEANGIFAVVMVSGEFVKFAVDRIRTFPLFYSLSNNEIIISDRNSILPDSKWDEISFQEFKNCGFVSGKETLLKDKFQVQAGEYLEYSKGKIKGNFYFNYSVSESVKNQTSKVKLTDVFDRLIQRVINYSKGEKLIVPLSGGYDSRLLVTLLRKYGYDNVLCFTYGRANSDEVAISKKVADTLGYDWVFVEYIDQLIKGFSTDNEFKSFFFDLGSNASSLSHVQDFFAVRELVKRKLITETSIFLPGHSGDFLAGGHLKQSWRENSSKAFLLKAVFEKHYKLKTHKRDHEELKQKVSSRLQSGLTYSVFEDFNIKERQAKFIVNSVRVYEQFGCRYLLPLWDAEIIDFFKFLPLDQKMNCVYYNDVLKNVFKENKVDFTRVDQSLMEYVLGKILPKPVKEFIKGLVAPKVDPNNFSIINNELGAPKGTYISTVLVDFFLKKQRNGID